MSIGKDLLFIIILMSSAIKDKKPEFHVKLRFKIIKWYHLSQWNVTVRVIWLVFSCFLIMNSTNFGTIKMSNQSNKILRDEKIWVKGGHIINICEYSNY